MKTLRTTVVLLSILTFLCGVVYPLAVTGIAQLVFPMQANGSVVVKHGRLTGSDLIGQQFDDPKYFWGRPSSTVPYSYNAASSSGSNLGQSNPALIQAVKKRAWRLRQSDPANNKPIPIDLVSASASGLDPHISPSAAQYQMSRVAAARGLSQKQIQTIIAANTEGRLVGILGEPRVNVLRLNLALDDIK